MADAAWTPGTATVTVDPSGTLLGSFELKDGAALVATVTFTMTAKRSLVVNVHNEPGTPGLSDFVAWSDR